MVYTEHVGKLMLERFDLIAADESLGIADTIDGLEHRFTNRFVLRLQVE